MRVLLVNPAFPDSYWSGRFALPFVRRRSLLPPLGLITVAALLPRAWELRLVDLDVEPLEDRDILWAEVVMLTGMLVQRPSAHRVLRRCRALGRRTVVGGPAVTALPGEFSEADHLVLGEGEDLVPVLAEDLAAGRPRPIYREETKPDLATAPAPRYDLLRPGAYHQMSLQYSRGCPFNCEFCDIIVMYGRKPRTKTASQVLAELELIRGTGFAGDVFFVDDNFIGNKKAVRTVLPAIAEWRRRIRPPLEFYTEASMNLADDPALVDQMTGAGFTAVFIGIESPSEEALRETRKTQNLHRSLAVQVHGLLERGLDVWGGFILGFDSDRPDCFDRMIGFIQEAAIPYAMVGILGALPNTPLYRRLKREGRLRHDLRGDQFGLTNVITRIPADALLAGYRRVLETVYEPETYFRRCRENLARWKPAPGAPRSLVARDLASAWRAIRGQGIGGTYRRAYWRFLRWVLRHHPEKLGRALAQAAAGHHYITYTRRVVIPALLETVERLPTITTVQAVPEAAAS
ncbi:MAG: B12-binding domain-containing radical SAM protein [Candidatus Polarisedimenticolia bacterium]